MKCKICSSEVAYFGCGTVLQEYNVSYFLCEGCGFVQTEEPYWLDKAYSSAITRSDVGLVRRNIMLAKRTKAIVNMFFKGRMRFVDYGGGHGLFVRLMRDTGFDFSYYDKYCNNLFARDFESEPERKGQYELLTAFEVFEHLSNPLEEISTMLEFSRNILFSTELLPEDVPKPDAWWYYGLEHGQHISFYSKKSLGIMAKQLSLNFYSDQKSFHLLTERKVSPFLFKFTSKAAALFYVLFNRKSLLPADYKTITGKDFV